MLSLVYSDVYFLFISDFLYSVDYWVWTLVLKSDFKSHIYQANQLWTLDAFEREQGTADRVKKLRCIQTIYVSFYNSSLNFVSSIT